jgi:predicted nucleic acid-binding protein
MRRSSPSTRSYLLDNNVFVAAINNPLRQTATLRLILHMIRDETVSLVGNIYLAEEMIRYAERYPSNMVASLIEALASKMEIVEVEERLLKICRNYMGTDDPTDLSNAATCLQTSATLVTNDRHFNRIRNEEIIRVLSITDAVNELIGM